MSLALCVLDSVVIPLIGEPKTEPTDMLRPGLEVRSRKPSTSLASRRCEMHRLRDTVAGSRRGVA